LRRALRPRHTAWFNRKDFHDLVMLPHFIHIGATRLNAIGSGMVPRLAVVSVFAEKNPDLGLERA
jgi:hypothetical protein